MAFRRSPVRSRSGPPSFARAPRELRMAGHEPSCLGPRAHHHQRRMVRQPWLLPPPTRVDRFKAGSLVTLRIRHSARHHSCRRHGVAAQRFVYVLRSRNHPSHFYTGRTFNIKERLASHNAGECTATKKYRPWDLDVVVAFRDETRALAFERYLKSGSACAFAKRHLR